MSRIIKWVNSSQIHIMQVDPKTTNIFKQILKVKHEFDPNLSVFFFTQTHLYSTQPHKKHVEFESC